MIAQRLRAAFWLHLLLAAIVLSGCSQNPDVKKRQYLERGTAYHADGKYNEAIIQLKNALQIDPKFGPALHALGRAYAARSWHTDAARELQRAVEIQPGNLEARADLAQAYLDLEAWNDALAEGQKIREKAPESATELYIRGAATLGKGQPKEAVELLTRAVASGAATPQMHKSHGDALVAVQRLDEAEKAYRGALAARPKYGEALIGLGALQLRRNQREAALETLSQAKAADPQNPKVRLAMSSVRVAEGKLPEAIKELEELPRQAWSPRVVLALGNLYLRSKQPERATLVMRPFVKAFPDVPVGHYLLGHAALSAGRTDEAVTEFQAVASRMPDNPLARYTLGVAQLAAQRPREAFKEFERVAKPMEKVSEFHLNSARAHLALGQTDAAQKSAEAALALAPQTAPPYAVLGSIHATKGDLARAAQMYGKALEVDPSFTPGRVALGNIYNIDKKPEEALKEYDTALQTAPGYGPALQAKVATLVRQKRVDEAIAAVQTALKSEPKDARLIT